MDDFHWKWLVLAVIVAGAVMFSVDRCTTASVLVAKEKANTNRDIQFGLGKRKD